jgi:hypothetical protein
VLGDGNRLDALRVEGNEHSAVRAAFDLSYAAFDDEARTMFRRLGLLIGHDVTPAATAGLADMTTTTAQRLPGCPAAHPTSTPSSRCGRASSATSWPTSVPRGWGR